MSGSHRDDRPALIALGLLVAAIVLVSALGLASRYFAANPQPNADGSGAQYSYGERGPSEGYWVPEFSSRDTYAQWAMTGLAFVATIISVVGVFLIRQTFIETKRTADAATAQLRPWLHIRNFTVTNASMADMGQWTLFLNWEYEIVNTGASAALNVTSYVLPFSDNLTSLRTAEFEARGIQEFSADGGWAIAPGSTFHNSNGQASRAPNQDGAGGMSLWIAIVVTYKGPNEPTIFQTTQTFLISEKQDEPRSRIMMRVEDLKLGRANPRVEQLGRSRMS